jgi:integrase
MTMIETEINHEIKKKRRLRGMGSTYRRRRIWWICVYHRGEPHRESSHSESEAQAERLLKQRLGEIAKGRFVPNEERLTFDEMTKDLENDYRVNRRRSIATALFHVKHLRGFFGFDRAVDLTPDRVKAYQAHRLQEGAANATINREVACLGKMLTLALEAGKLSRRPKFKLLEGEKIREGFIDHGEFLVLLDRLPEHLKPLIEFLYLSGWRKGAGRKLEWSYVDLIGRVVRLSIANSKTKDAQVLPLTGRLWEIIQEQARRRVPECPFVFHHDGEQIGDFRKAWKRACKEAGVSGLLIHDFRRCAARNLSRAGVPREVAMKITGHKTESMYRRYRIVDERDIKEATERMQAHLAEQLKPPHPVIVPVIINPGISTIRK